MKNAIYKITNKIDGKSYIGLAVNFQKRMNAHKSLSNKDNPKQHIHRAIKKYGWDNFTKEVIRSGFETNQMLEAAEIFYIAFYNTFYNGYNMTRGGEGNLGYEYGEKHAQAVSKALNRIEENGLTVAQNSANKTVHGNRAGKNNSFYGKTHSEEARKKIAKNSSKLNGTKKTEEHRKKISIASKGVLKSEQAKQAMRDAKAREPIRICPHCGKEGKGGNMPRYHFDNCNKLNKSDV